MIKNCKTYYQLKESKKKYVINQGSSRSGKTYSILQIIIEWCYLHQNSHSVISIVRKTLPALKGSAYRDFLEILQKCGWYDECHHNKTDLTYNLFNNLIEFISVDQPQKIRGRKRTICFINECNELNYEDFFQLDIRTTFKMILDYNPSDFDGWFYDLSENKETSDFFITTYLDNPHLEKELVEKIEALQEADKNYWTVFGLGQRGVPQDLVFNHWKYCERLPEGETFYGLDFGYNNPSALVKVCFKENSIFAEELLYKTKLTTTDLIEQLKCLNIEKYDEIFCDSAEPKTREELYRAGFNAKISNKEVYAGIQAIKSYPLYVTRNSISLVSELKSYKWKLDKDNKPLDEPVKFKDHIIDALRYAVHTKLTKPKFQIIV